MKYLSLGVIIVNFCTADLVCECLLSLSVELRTYRSRIIVVDNNSKDESIKKISSYINEMGWFNWVHVIVLDQNNGFSYGNNIALQYFFSSNNVPDFIWLLNPDTIVKQDGGKKLVNFLQSRLTAGIVGSRLEDPDGTSQVSAFRHHSLVSELLAGLRLGVLDDLCAKWVVAPVSISEFPLKTDWVAGASMMIRKEVFEQIGFFDDGYFLYFEEEDFCKQAHDAGWECWYIPESRVVHLVGAASGISDTRKKAPRRPGYWFESRRRFFLKNYGRAALILADLILLVSYSLWIVRRKIQNKKDLDPPHFLKDLFFHSFFFKGFRL